MHAVYCVREIKVGPVQAKCESIIFCGCDSLPKKKRTGLSGFPHLVLEPVQCSNLCITCSFIFNLYSVLLFCWWSYISYISMMSARGFSHVPCDRPLVPRASKKFTGAACEPAKTLGKKYLVFLPNSKRFKTVYRYGIFNVRVSEFVQNYVEFMLVQRYRFN